MALARVECQCGHRGSTLSRSTIQVQPTDIVQFSTHMTRTFARWSSRRGGRIAIRWKIEKVAKHRLGAVDIGLVGNDAAEKRRGVEDARQTVEPPGTVGLVV